MPFPNEQIEQYLLGISDDRRDIARDLLSSPDKLSKYIEAHKKANEEARIRRQYIDVTWKALFGNDPPSESEIEEIANNIDYIRESGEVDYDRYTEVLSELGAMEMIENGEVEAEELGLYRDEETGEILVDQDDGEIYTDDDGYLVNGNGYYVDADGELIDDDEPVHVDEVENGAFDSILADRQQELDAKLAEIATKERNLKVSELAIKNGVLPDKMNQFLRLWDDPAVEGEPTEEILKAHFDKYRTDVPNFFAGSGVAGMNVDTSRIMKTDLNAQYESAQSRGDVQEMLALNKNFRKE